VLDCFLHPAVPDIPVNFNISAQNDALLNTTVTFTWDPPPGTGVKTILDNYVLSVVPQSLSHPASNFVYSDIINVTLKYNLEYTATLIAVNCAGNSNPPAILTNLEFSKH
jgi:hypothetical protein